MFSFTRPRWGRERGRHSDGGRPRSRVNASLARCDNERIRRWDSSTRVIVVGDTVAIVRAAIAQRTEVRVLEKDYEVALERIGAPILNARIRNHVPSLRDYGRPKEVVGVVVRKILVKDIDLTARNVVTVYGKGVPGFSLGVGHLGPVGGSIASRYRPDEIWAPNRYSVEANRRITYGGAIPVTAAIAEAGPQFDPISVVSPVRVRRAGKRLGDGVQARGRIGGELSLRVRLRDGHGMRARERHLTASAERNDRK